MSLLCCYGIGDDFDDGVSVSCDNHTHYNILVQTGDRKGSGTNANIYITLLNATKVAFKRIHLDKLLHDDFERGKVRSQTAKFEEFEAKLPADFGAVEEIELWRDQKGSFDTWYLEKIDIYETPKGGESKGPYVFPVHRWIPAKKSVIFAQYDAVLPQHDPRKDTQRKEEMKRKKKEYRLGEHAAKVRLPIPRQVAKLPNDEDFSFEYLVSLKP